MSFTVRPFAFMRLTHEALRTGFARLVQLAGVDDVEAVELEYSELKLALEIHAAQEEAAFFPLLDARFDGAVERAGLRDAHEREQALQDAFEAALSDRDPASVRRALADWAPSFEQHLKKEEEVMMPLTQKIAPTLAGRAAAVADILDVDWEGLKTDHLPYVVRALSTTKPYGPNRMFVAALQAAAGPRYAELTPIVSRAMTATMAAQMRAHGHL